uniref:Uncharacterized protein n=1 Tax=Rhizophagus irregularis (strain DAOM 181602 / DAOM 197198 / MUCL 43194) TaxID=747089 RepID=U9TME8_RHIID
MLLHRGRFPQEKNLSKTVDSTNPTNFTTQAQATNIQPTTLSLIFSIATYASSAMPLLNLLDSLGTNLMKFPLYVTVVVALVVTPMHVVPLALPISTFSILSRRCPNARQPPSQSTLDHYANGMDFDQLPSIIDYHQIMETLTVI